jgi:hypothetical protein
MLRSKKSSLFCKIHWVSVLDKLDAETFIHDTYCNHYSKEITQCPPVLPETLWIP